MKVYFDVEGQGFAAEMGEDRSIRRLWIVADGVEIEDAHNAIWNNLAPAFECLLSEAASDAWFLAARGNS